MSEFISNKIDTSRVTTKHYCNIILFYKFSNETDIFRELLPNTTDVFHRRCTKQYFFLSQMWTYSKSLLTWTSAEITFRKVFDLKKLLFIGGGGGGEGDSYPDISVKMFPPKTPLRRTSFHFSIITDTVIGMVLWVVE